MFKRIAVSVLAVVFVAAALGAAGAGSDGAGKGPLARFFASQIGKFKGLKEKLGVTDEQKTKIRGVIQSHRPEIAEAAKSVIAKKRALETAVLASNIDEKAIRAAGEDLGKSIGDAAVLAAKVRAEVWPVLTPEQQTMIDSFRVEREKSVDQLVQEFSEGAK